MFTMKNLTPPPRRPWPLAATAALALCLLRPEALAVDHGEFIDAYQGPQTCALCHPQAANEVMATTHWTWEYTDPKTGDQLGKNNVINNFCIAVPSNEPRCTSCHVGLGYTDKTFDFSDRTKVDCLVCHDTTCTYKKTPTGAGHPDPAVNLLAVAQSVGKSSRATCGACHFYGGGGDAVKHGDLDSTMTNPPRSLDVHMGTDGLNQNCAFCHVRAGRDGKGHHVFRGSHYTEGEGAHTLACADCHTAAPHDSALQNMHSARVACQTCHIPAFARGGKATKMTWDWSTAGQKGLDGKNQVIRDSRGNPTYDTMKGTFQWAAQVPPDYVWFNGEVDYLTLDDLIQPGSLVTLTTLQGAFDDPRSRLFPVKRFTGRQPYDAGTQRLAIPHLFPRQASDLEAYWKSYDWARALTAGMASVGKTFSGQVGFVETEMFWVQNHVVAPKEQALTCADCHTPRSRLQFAALGYPAERALQLQTKAGFEIGDFAVGHQGAGLTLQWTGTPGNRYQVQSSTDLRTWTDEADGERTVGGAAAELSWTEAPGAAAPARFYRVLRAAQ
ncbi:MAG: tetrathionate reductase family octaheme c-type cytochrome [Verrucomicrobia bacterium]|nr:tetrathionate reductase family octaheme c-type cytochrome [Verrucomicrobiota bacterium]